MFGVVLKMINQVEDYVPGFQPYPFLTDRYLGLRPRLVCRRTFGPQRHNSIE